MESVCESTEEWPRQWYAPNWAFFAGLQTPVLSRMPTPTGVFITAVCDYLWAAMLERAGKHARDLGSSSTGATNVKMAVSKDAELRTLVSKLGLQAEFDVSSRPTTEFECDPDNGASEFPLFQAKIKKLLETYAWFSKPEEGSEEGWVLADWYRWPCSACYCLWYCSLVACHYINLFVLIVMMLYMLPVNQYIAIVALLMLLSVLQLLTIAPI